MQSQKVLLVILDGWGLGQVPEVDAIAQAPTPGFDRLMQNYPNAKLVTFGEEVGLPEGQMGNSEVGHLNIGAGRVVYQSFAQINKAMRDGELAQKKALLDAIEYAKKEQKAVHLLGLVSDGGVHSHINHLLALCDICNSQGQTETYIHAFMDGRDTAPTGGKQYLTTLTDHIQGAKVQLASVIGRYYAMDRDNRWERIKLAYDLLIHGKGEASHDMVATIGDRYAAGETDEFLKPFYQSDENGQPIATINEGDVVLFFNFRTDRPRQLTRVLSQEDMPEHGMQKLALRYLTMTRYDEAFEGVEVLFTKDNLVNTLGEVLSKAGKTQLRIAETEKYAHVTFFFSGGREDEFTGEHRILINSPKVDTYDQKPEMSAYEVTEAVVKDIQEQAPDFICLNYANTDMVGHTGDFSAAQKAATTVDECLTKLLAEAVTADYAAIVIADHGNSDIMINPDGSPHTAHTTNLVPVIYVAKDASQRQIHSGKLGDIAPTILALMGIDQPSEMTGESLID